jgi:triosephosphate isomerase
VAVGAQSCHPAEGGAHTGDLSAAMLADAGASHVIVGHSERRADHGERNDDVRAQARAVLEAGLKVIVCVGETEAQRDASNTLDIISGQLAGSVPDLVTGENLDGRL